MSEFSGLFLGLSVAIFFGFLAWGIYAVSKRAPKWLKFLLAPLFLLFVVISVGTLCDLLGITYQSFQPNTTQLVVTTPPSVTQPTSPSVPTLTRTPTRKPTATIIAIPAATITPILPPSKLSTPTPKTVVPIVTAGDSNVNIRSGPGTNYDIIGTLKSGQSLEIIGRNTDSSWWQVSTANGLGWVAAGVSTASNADASIPVVETLLPPIPAFTPPHTTTPTAVRITGSYKGDVFLSINIMMDAIRQINELFSNPQFDNQDWKYEVENLARRVQKNHKFLSEMQAPDDMADIHAALLDGTADCDQSMIFLIDSLYSTDHAELHQASELLNSCGDKVAVRIKILEEKTSE
jgi:hypothetical protein